MSLKPRKISVALITLGTAALFAGLSCRLPNPAAYGVAGRPSSSVSGWLPQPMEYYVAHPDEFASFASLLFIAGGETDAMRPSCVGDLCEAQASSPTTLSIDGLSDGYLFKPKVAGLNGTIVARIVNLGPTRDWVFRTKPSGTAGIAYYMVVSHSTSDQSTWKLYEFSRQPLRVALAGAQGDFRPCEPRRTPTRRIPVVRFGGCERNHMRVSLAHGGPLADEALQGGTGAMWAECGYGCCEGTTSAR